LEVLVSVLVDFWEDLESENLVSVRAVGHGLDPFLGGLGPSEGARGLCGFLKGSFRLLFLLAVVPDRGLAHVLEVDLPNFEQNFLALALDLVEFYNNSP